MIHMGRILFGFALALFSSGLFAQSSDETSIRKLLNDQVSAWNRGSIEDFMKGYWPNDSLHFVGHGGMTSGYSNTLKNYKKTYSDSAKMGKLFFTLLQLSRLSAEYYFVIGKWFLKRTDGNIGGYYTLLFRKINGHWLIITDHTS
jgi:ketosteroid isomerase-like protein